MSRLLSRLISESAIYGLGAAASQVVGIILIPIYARHLGATNYGVVAVLSTTISLTTVVTGLALSQAFFRTYLTEAETRGERRHVLGTTVTLRLLLSALAAVLVAAFSRPLGMALFGDPQTGDYLLLVAGIVFFDTTTVIPLSYLRAERRPLAYSLLSLTRAGLGSVLIILFVVFSGMEVRGVLLGSLYAALVTAAGGIAITLRAGLRLAWDTSLVRSMLTFSLPLVPAAAASWTLSFVDRFFLQALQGSHVVGVYAAGYTVGLVVNVLIVQPFTLMWGSAKWDIYRDESQAPEIFSRVTTAFAVAGSLAALGASALGTDVIRILLTPEFEAGRFVVPFSAFGAVLYAIYTLTGTGLNVAAKTGWVGATFVAAAALNIGLNVALIPPFGFMGAAYSTIAGYVFLATTTGILSGRFYPIPWELPQLAAALGIGFALAMASLLGPDLFVWRLACIVAYIPMLMALRVVSVADVRALRTVLLRR